MAFISHDVWYGTVKVLYKSKGNVVTYARCIKETRLFFPRDSGRVFRMMHIGAIRPTTKTPIGIGSNPGGSRSILCSLRVKKTLMLWGYGIQVLLWMDDEEIERVKNVISLEDWRKLMVILTGRKPKCRRCIGRDHLQKDCRERPETGKENKETVPAEKELTRDVTGSSEEVSMR